MQREAKKFQLKFPCSPLRTVHSVQGKARQGKARQGKAFSKAGVAMATVATAGARDAVRGVSRGTAQSTRRSLLAEPEDGHPDGGPRGPTAAATECAVTECAATECGVPAQSLERGASGLLRQSGRHCGAETLTSAAQVYGAPKIASGAATECAGTECAGTECGVLALIAGCGATGHSRQSGRRCGAETLASWSVPAGVRQLGVPQPKVPQLGVSSRR